MKLERLTKEERIGRAYDKSTIELVGVHLDHTYSDERIGSDGSVIPLQKVYNLMENVRRDVSSVYEKITGECLPAGPPKTEAVSQLRQAIYDHPLFLEAVDTLFGYGAYKELKDLNALSKTPWHNEIITGEIGHETVMGHPEDGFNFTTSYTDPHLAPAHSLEMHLNREGFVVPVRPVSTDGIVLAASDVESKTGYIVFGIRGGGGYPNTYHTVAAGGLGVTDALKEGRETIKDAFIRRELVPELGEKLKGISSDKIKAIGRFEDWLLGMGSVTYVFEVPTELNRKQILNSWGVARDKPEHTGLIFIPKNYQSILDFIEKNYKGFVENRSNRKDEERVLLHPGAMDLCVYGRINSSILKQYFQEGIH